MSALMRLIVAIVVGTAGVPTWAQAQSSQDTPPSRAIADATALQRQAPRGLVEQVQVRLAQRLGPLAQFEPLQLGDWTLSGHEADFELWGLLHQANQPVRMLRVRGRIERRSFELDRLELQAFDELQALQPAPRRKGL